MLNDTEKVHIIVNDGIAKTVIALSAGEADNQNINDAFLPSSNGLLKDTPSEHCVEYIVPAGHHYSEA